MIMRHTARGLATGALLGAASAFGLSWVVDQRMLGPCLPGAVVFGALLGFAASRLAWRGRIAALMPLGVAAAVSNAALAGAINYAAGDPMHLGARHLLDGVAYGLLGVFVLWWMVVPIGLAAGALVTFAVPRPRAAI
jgi:hypothetical protein